MAAVAAADAPEIQIGHAGPFGLDDARMRGAASRSACVSSSAAPAQRGTANAQRAIVTPPRTAVSESVQSFQTLSASGAKPRIEHAASPIRVSDLRRHVDRPPGAGDRLTERRSAAASPAVIRATRALRGAALTDQRDRLAGCDRGSWPEGALHGAERASKVSPWGDLQSSGSPVEPP